MDVPGLSSWREFLAMGLSLLVIHKNSPDLNWVALDRIMIPPPGEYSRPGIAARSSWLACCATRYATEWAEESGPV